MKIEKTLYLVASLLPTFDTKWSYSIWDSEPKPNDDIVRVVIKSYPFSDVIPDEDLPPVELTLVEEYEKQKQRRMARHEMEMRELDDKIAALLSLENKAA